jgi:hypothetical protein
VLGAPVSGLYTLAEIRERHALRVAVVSLAGTLNFGFVADPTIVPDLDRLARDVQGEVGALTVSLTARQEGSRRGLFSHSEFTFSGIVAALSRAVNFRFQR